MTGERACSDRRRSIVFVLFIIPLSIMLAVVLATSHSKAAEPQAASPTQATPYLPSVSDLMIATIQPRHRRLWQAAQNKDWAFAGYEVGNLQGAFRRLGEAHPTENDIPFTEMITSVTDTPLKALATAIDAKDETGFSKAYADLTDSCNACHQALGHGVVVIRVPSGKSASDQDFTTTTP
jgi:hypothetical protein